MQAIQVVVEWRCDQLVSKPAKQVGIYRACISEGLNTWFDCTLDGLLDEWSEKDIRHGAS